MGCAPASPSGPPFGEGVNQEIRDGAGEERQCRGDAASPCCAPAIREHFGHVGLEPRAERAGKQVEQETVHPHH